VGLYSKQQAVRSKKEEVSSLHVKLVNPLDPQKKQTNRTHGVRFQVQVNETNLESRRTGQILQLKEHVEIFEYKLLVCVRLACVRRMRRHNNRNRNRAERKETEKDKEKEVRSCRRLAPWTSFVFCVGWRW